MSPRAERGLWDGGAVDPKLDPGTPVPGTSRIGTTSMVTLLSNYLKILNHKCIERFQDDSYGFSKKHREEPYGETRDVRIPSGKYRTSFGNVSRLSSWRKTHPRLGAASALTPDRCSTASSSACAAGANGTDYRESLGDRQHHPSHLSTVGGTGCLGPNVGSPSGRVRRVGRCGLGMAGGRRSHGQGPFWGDLIGPNPTDRGKAGVKRSLLVDGRGWPFEHYGCGSQRS